MASSKNKPSAKGTNPMVQLLPSDNDILDPDVKHPDYPKKKWPVREEIDEEVLETVNFSNDQILRKEFNDVWQAAFTSGFNSILSKGLATAANVAKLASLKEDLARCRTFANLVLEDYILHHDDKEEVIEAYFLSRDEEMELNEEDDA